MTTTYDILKENDKVMFNTIRESACEKFDELPIEDRHVAIRIQTRVDVTIVESAQASVVTVLDWYNGVYVDNEMFAYIGYISEGYDFIPLAELTVGD